MILADEIIDILSIFPDDWMTSSLIAQHLVKKAGILPDLNDIESTLKELEAEGIVSNPIDDSDNNHSFYKRTYGWKLNTPQEVAAFHLTKRETK